ncbi:MAG: hypothetical protein KJ944_00030 [Alphaproteobacteria bacterium]|uniref:Uncharacterized protein n=1 Tax=viral metagenome TaxID=1070528 RepID=A0A6M3XZG5_9ZZZZ|nr:hypothetical protein [Alphaproteobacteria bacterium]MBU1561516.1 hypothetical protein [Alphaproteobacteria bacterium]MBU2300961.1 hypothetical protein [Alphaproteobacteria bacterium]MBU2368412.1 hypothetical protein [Alphaproteobacteria bacterium]
MTDEPKTAEDLVRETVKILQRGLPGRDLDDRGVIIELWGPLDTKRARGIYQPATPPKRP